MLFSKIYCIFAVAEIPSRKLRNGIPAKIELVMKKERLANPFVYQGYESPEYFCDREEETSQLLSNLRNGRNVTLISPRRIGKTGLIQNTFYRIKEADKNAVCLYLDIYATKNLRDFVEHFGLLVLDSLVKKNESLLKKAAGFLGSLRPTLSVNPLDGEPTFSVRVEDSQAAPTIRSIFEYLNRSNRDVYVAIDEFQKIAEYPEDGTEALLRSYIQFSQHIHFIFSGSRQHLMTEIFASPKHPFYQSTEMMTLGPLGETVYYDFCRKFFQEKGGDLSNEVFNEAYRRYDGHTWYIQCLMNRLYESEKNVSDISQLTAATVSVLKGREPQYETLSQFFTENQMNLLKAIAAEGVVAQPTSAEFIRGHRLMAPSSVRTALEALEEKDLVYRTGEGYMIYDRFMALWLRRQ